MMAAPSRRIATLLVALAVVAGLAACTSEPRTPAHSGARTSAAAGHASCFGAAAMVASNHCPATTTGELTPIPKRAASDKSQAYGSVSGKKDCFARQPKFAMDVCHFGDPSAKVSVALVGNSHAGEWLPALQRIIAKHHWKLTTYLASRCANAYLLQSLGPDPEDTDCLRWAHRSTQLITSGHYNLVVMTNRVSVPAAGKTLSNSQKPYARGYQQVLEAFQQAGLPVVGIRDSPAPGFQIPACLRTHRDNYGACAGTRAKWLPEEPLTTAIRQLHDARVVEADLTDYICHPVVCPAAIGGVPVYFDASHMTATFAATLAPYLEPYVTKALG